MGVLRFADKFFAAFGAGNGDFSLPLGNTDILAAAGAVKIPVILILKALQQHQIPPVFPVALVGVSGKGTEDRPEHQRVGYQGQHKIQPVRPDKHGQQTRRKAGAQDHHIQFIRTVAALHEPLQSVSHFFSGSAQPIAEAIHKHITFVQDILSIL